MVVRERVREARHREVTLVVDSRHPGPVPSDEFSTRFERRIREVASRAVAHLKRGDSVTVRSTGGERAGSVPSRGADPLLRFLALLDATPTEETAPGAPNPSKTTSVARDREVA